MHEVEHTRNRLTDLKSTLSGTLEQRDRDRAIILGAVLPSNVQCLAGCANLLIGRHRNAVEALNLRNGRTGKSHKGGDGGEGELHLVCCCLFSILFFFPRNFLYG